MKARILVLLLVVGIAVCGEPVWAGGAGKPMSAKKFDSLASSALEAMKQRAAELKIGGVAVVNYAPGDSVQEWTSKMAVVGRMKDVPTDTTKGNNLLGIAYAKSAEMADTLQNSGTANRPPMTGEFGWQGGVVEHMKSGYLIVSFSGGKSEDDVQVSKAGLEVMKKGL
jgi:1,6-anhydro-N-acetylmuramate kinase